MSDWKEVPAWKAMKELEKGVEVQVKSSNGTGGCWHRKDDGGAFWSWRKYRIKTKAKPTLGQLVDHFLLGGRVEEKDTTSSESKWEVLTCGVMLIKYIYKYRLPKGEELRKPKND